jgi:eukaryotic-like serine/threonine-protein kinase
VTAPDDARLLSVAGSISNGASVDWDRLSAEERDADTSRVLRELQAVERIVEFHRGAEPTDAPTAEDTMPSDSTAPVNWGHLTLLERIDTGAFGSVYRAHDPKLQADVALKLVPLAEDRGLDPSRALKEARLLARVRHPNVVRVHGADVIDGRVGIWMEFIDGQTLTTLLSARGPLGPREAAIMGADLCQALAAVHAAGLIHGDVKARNVMREAGGRTVLMDFGTGKDLRLAPRVTAGIDVAGTPLYIAPEVFRGEPRSALSDIYSLGVLLFHLVTGEYPVPGRTRAEVEEAHTTGAHIRLRDRRADAPAAFVDAVERAIAIDPHERFQSIGAFEAALARFLGRADAPAPVRWPWTRWAAAGVGVAGLIAAAYWAENRGSKSPPPVVTARAPADIGAIAQPPAYRIESAFYKRRDGGETRLRSGDRVAPNDELFARLRVSAPTYVYIVNEDDNGESFVLFPLPGQAVENPIVPGATIRIPGTRAEEVTWQISSAGGREHFLVFASSERLDAFEELFAALPRPTFGRPVTSSRLTERAVGKLRGVGGLTAAPTAQPGARLAAIFTSPLGDGEETARGLWVRQLTVENPSSGSQR